VDRSSASPVRRTQLRRHGLTNGTTYFYVVSASYTGGPDAGGESANSSQATVMPVSTSPTPTATRNLTATPTPNQTASTPTRTPTPTPTRTPTPTATPQGPPAPPSGLTANATGRKKINLHWTQSPSSGVTNNGIYRRTSGGSYPSTPTVTISAATSYNDTGLASGTTYCYVVTAISASGESAQSNESCDKAK
jgi:hypothetical protein